MSAAPVLSSGAALFRARTASVIGREHVRLGRNNQDGVFAVEERAASAVQAQTVGKSQSVQPERVGQNKESCPGQSERSRGTEGIRNPIGSAEVLDVARTERFPEPSSRRSSEPVEGCRPPITTAVVCDGCGSEPRSEIGAQLGARFLAQWLAVEAAREELSGELAERATLALVDWLGRFAALMEPDASHRAGFVQSQLLFTFLAAAATPGRALVFGVGDGVVQVDGSLRVLDSGADNAPDYAAYALSGAKLSPALHFLGGATRIALATDGLAAHLCAHPRALEPWLDDPVVWKNPVQLQRRLTVLAAQERFVDDATVALLSLEG